MSFFTTLRGAYHRTASLRYGLENRSFKLPRAIEAGVGLAPSSNVCHLQLGALREHWLQALQLACGMKHGRVPGQGSVLAELEVSRI